MSLNHSWRRAAEIYCGLLFSEGPCPFLDACPVMSSSRFLSGRSFWIPDSKFKPRRCQEVGNVNQWFTFCLAGLEEANKNFLSCCTEPFVRPDLCAASPTLLLDFHLLVSLKHHLLIGKWWLMPFVREPSDGPGSGPLLFYIFYGPIHHLSSVRSQAIERQ